MWSHQTKISSIWLGLTSRIWPSGEVPWDVCVFDLNDWSSQTGYVINCIGLCLFVSDPVKRTALWLPRASICCSKTPLFRSVVTSSSPGTTCGLCPLIPEWSFVPKWTSHRDAFHTSTLRHKTWVLFVTILYEDKEHASFSSHLWPLKAIRHIDHRGAGWSTDLHITLVCVVCYWRLKQTQMVLFFIPRVHWSSPTAKVNVCLGVSLSLSLSFCLCGFLPPSVSHLHPHAVITG